MDLFPQKVHRDAIFRISSAIIVAYLGECLHQGWATGMEWRNRLEGLMANNTNSPFGGRSSRQSLL